jgi:hypothetical protein
MRSREGAGTEPRVTLVDRIVLNRHGYGTDWGAARIVVAKRGDAEVWRIPGHTAWIDRMTPSGYCAAKLYVYNGGGYEGARVLCEGGRLTPEMLQAHREEIDRVFGRGITRLMARALPVAWRSKKTIVITPQVA